MKDYERTSDVIFVFENMLGVFSFLEKNVLCTVCATHLGIVADFDIHVWGMKLLVIEFNGM